MHKVKFLSVLFFVFWNLQAWSQKWITVQKNQDSVHFKASQILITKDTLFISAVDSFVILKKDDKYRIRSNPYFESKTFYDSLKIKSCKNRIAKQIFQLLIKTESPKVQQVSNFERREKAFLKFQGKKIRKIHLKKVDIIEGSIYDTSIVASSFWAKRANNIHISTREYVIYRNLTVKEGDFVDAVNLSDNERILRITPYIEDARILVIPISSDATQVDLLVVTKDKFSVGVGFNYNGLNNFQTFFYNKNFIGAGHEVRNYLIYRKGYDPEYGYALKYSINNVFNSFTSFSLGYENSWEKQFKGININKDFITQQTKYAGGLSLYENSTTREYKSGDSTIIVPYKVMCQDYWIGRAFPINKINGTTFNTSFRFANANFIKRPYISADSNSFYHDQSLFLASFSLIQLKYYLSNLVYGFGVTEDIPYGYKLNLMLGYERDQFINQPYLGAVFTYGKHFTYPGYLLFDLEFGSFYSRGTPKDRILKFKLSNIGDLQRFQRYSLRHFFSIDYQSGYNMSDPDYKAVINGRWTSIVSGLKKDALKGQQKLTLDYENVLFTPWYILGFKFAMLSYIDLGWVSQENRFKNISFYGNVGVGVRIKNESWIFETITLGLAYFLSAPKGSDRVGFIFDGTDPRLFKNLTPSKPDLIRMDQSPVLFSE